MTKRNWLKLSRKRKSVSNGEKMTTVKIVVGRRNTIVWRAIVMMSLKRNWVSNLSLVALLAVTHHGVEAYRRNRLAGAEDPMFNYKDNEDFV